MAKIQTLAEMEAENPEGFVNPPAPAGWEKAVKDAYEKRKAERQPDPEYDPDAVEIVGYDEYEGEGDDNEGDDIYGNGEDEEGDV